jgi:hypothetical protein
MRIDWRWWNLLLLGGIALGAPLRAADPEAEKTALAVEALSRLQGVDIDANPKLKETILKVLGKIRGTANFVKLVQQFNLSGQNAGLLHQVESARRSRRAERS